MGRCFGVNQAGGIVGMVAVVLTIFLLLEISGSNAYARKLHINAYEYRRKFGTSLKLGGCPEREVQVDLGNNSAFWAREYCIYTKEGTVSSHNRELNDTRNVVLPTASDIISYLGLCGSEAAAYLGILNKGDCVTVEIASELVFNEKTVVRAYVQSYQKSLDILEVTRKSTEFDRHYENKYYLEELSYGTLEVILLQVQFRSEQDASRAKELDPNTLLMSDYMMAMARAMEVPRHTMIIRLSTAEMEDYSIKKFNAKQYGEAIRHCQIMESDIRHIQEMINSGEMMPHLKYGFLPFHEPPPKPSKNDLAGGRLTGPVHWETPVLWEKISILAVTLKQSITIGKQAVKQCKGHREKRCTRVRDLRRKLKEALQEVQKCRREWTSLTREQRTEMTRNFTATTNAYDNVMKQLASEVKKKKKFRKLEEVKRRQQEANQTGGKTNILLLRKLLKTQGVK